MGCYSCFGCFDYWDNYCYYYVHIHIYVKMNIITMIGATMMIIGIENTDESRVSRRDGQ